MPNRTLHDMIDWTRNFHQHMHAILSQSAQQTKNERARMLLEYLAEHEHTLAHTIRRFDETASDTASNTWVSDYKEQFPPSEHDHPDRPYASMTTEEIMHAVNEQHLRVIGRYQNLKDFVQGAAQDLIEQIVEMEEQEIQRMAQSANRLEDL